MINMGYKLSDLRKEMKDVSQLHVAARAGTSLNSVVNAENLERKMHYSTLIKILNAVNSLRQERGLSTAKPEEMEWNIR